jgi:hypothetical protein
MISIVSHTIAAIINTIGLAARNAIAVQIAPIQASIHGTAIQNNQIQVTSIANAQATIIISSVSSGFFSIRSDIFSTIGNSFACIPSSIGWNCHQIFAIVFSNSADNMRCWLASPSDVFAKSPCNLAVCSYNNHSLAVVFSCAVISLSDSISHFARAYALMLVSFNDTQNLSRGSASHLIHACIAPIASATSTLNTDAISAALFVRFIVSSDASFALLPIFCNIAPTGVASWLKALCDNHTAFAEFSQNAKSSSDHSPKTTVRALIDSDKLDEASILFLTHAVIAPKATPHAIAIPCSAFSFLLEKLDKSQFILSSCLVA